MDMLKAGRGTKRMRTARSRQTEEAKVSEQKDFWRALKLSVCLFIFIAAAAAKLLFPSAARHASETVFEAIAGEVDCRAAAETIGLGIRGERDMKSALFEACEYAFVPRGEVEGAGIQEMRPGKEN